MSQSDAHRDLVLRVASELESRYPQFSVTTDIQQNPGDPTPPLINGFRPDVYATTKKDLVSVIIAEAKTDGDLDNWHTEDQLSTFINHLEQKGNGSFILSVTGYKSDHAKTLLRFIRQANQVTDTALIVFDSHDFWKLDLNSGLLWHLI